MFPSRYPNLSPKAIPLLIDLGQHPDREPQAGGSADGIPVSLEASWIFRKVLRAYEDLDSLDNLALFSIHDGVILIPNHQDGLINLQLSAFSCGEGFWLQ